jgi:hypothetical protein
MRSRKAKEGRLKTWEAVLWQWNQPGYMTFSAKQMAKKMGFCIEHLYDILNTVSEVKRFGLSPAEYLSRTLPCYMPQANHQRETKNLSIPCRIKYERALMYMLDGGKSKGFVAKFLRKLPQKGQHSNRAEQKFSITTPELLMLWPLDDLCPICKTTKMSLDGGRNSSDNASLDRKDNSRGYVSGNCGWVCYKCNTDKGTLTAEKADRIAAWARSAE